VFSNVATPPPCDLTLVDFDTEAALVGGLGPQDETCNVARIDCAGRVPNSGKLRVVLNREEGGVGCTCNPQTVRPIVASKIALPVVRVRTIFEEVVLDCP
jgi:hypothetical protein